MPDVFVSYKREDRGVAERIAGKLKKLGLDVWIDSRLSAGEAFDAGIETALREAKAVLVLWSPASVGSEWVRNEASVGKERGVLVALMVAPCEPPLAFRSTHYELLHGPRFGDDDANWGRIVERLQMLVGRHADVAKLQRRRIRKAKRGRTYMLLLAWVLAIMPISLIATYVADTAQPILPGQYFVSFGNWDNGYFRAMGTWEATDDPLATPINYVHIDCDRQRGVCVEAEAYIIERGPILSGSVTERTIVKWDESVIVTSDDYIAATRTMTISLPSQSITAIRLDDCSTESAVCSPSGRVDYRLIDGTKRGLAQSRPSMSAIGWLWGGTLLAWTFFTAFRIYRVWRPRR